MAHLRWMFLLLFVLPSIALLSAQVGQIRELIVTKFNFMKNT